MPVRQTRLGGVERPLPVTFGTPLRQIE
jgi:hypothetical protein